MTLSKALCQSCVKKSLIVGGWNDIDDARWKDGWVFCPKSKDVVKNDKIPELCGFSLEHVVSEKEMP